MIYIQQILFSWWFIVRRQCLAVFQDFCFFQIKRVVFEFCRFCERKLPLDSVIEWCHAALGPRTSTLYVMYMKRCHKKIRTYIEVSKSALFIGHLVLYLCVQGLQWCPAGLEITSASLWVGRFVIREGNRWYICSPPLRFSASWLLSREPPLSCARYLVSRPLCTVPERLSESDAPRCERAITFVDVRNRWVGGDVTINISQGSAIHRDVDQNTKRLETLHVLSSLVKSLYL